MNLAQTLIADPTFNLMSRAEKLEEARAIAIVSGMEDDDLAFALAVEEAEGLLASGFQPLQAQEPVSAGIEPCREDRPVCASPVAGNGRCLECGARRASETPSIALENGSVIEFSGDPEPIKSRETVKPAAPVLARFKAVTGHNDRDIGDLLNLARSTVQGYVAGRMAEKLTPAQLTVLRGRLRATAQQAQAMADEIGVSFAERFPD